MAYPAYYNLLPIVVGCAIYLLSKRYAENNFLEKRINIQSSGLNIEDIQTLRITGGIVQHFNSAILELRRSQVICKIKLAPVDAARAMKRKLSIDSHLTAVTDEVTGLGLTKYCSAGTFSPNRIAEHFYSVCLNNGGLKIAACMSPAQFLSANNIIDSSTLTRKTVLSIINSSSRLNLACNISQRPSLKLLLTNYSRTSAFLLTMCLIGRVEVILYR
ncbi:MAG TPA: hypothetical protein VND15_02000 [Candidatus Acidoferrales bacterium]|nr:hypothetical protein [Candidatus Acidoferrales bacterium]